jgi:hypothetical protein
MGCSVLLPRSYLHSLIHLLMRAMRGSILPRQLLFQTPGKFVNSHSTLQVSSTLLLLATEVEQPRDWCEYLDSTSCKTRNV